VRVSGQGLRHVSITAGRTIVTADGHVLALAGLQIGDTLVRRSSTELADISQRWIELQGIVAMAPDPDGDSMVVHLQPATSVLVVFEPATRISGKGLNGGQRGLISEGDLVKMTGAFNERLGEITETATVLVVKPKRQKG
jgi:hypothetical protein